MMTLQLDLPQDVLELLGSEPEREVLEALLLYLVRQEKMTGARAGEMLGLDRWEAIEWYNRQGHQYPDYTEEDLEHDLQVARDHLGL
ncbi:MAG: UPF0175 family protein [Deinococcota bacterium]|jgi:predicted HTH domain antitoxin|nr:UPF0175 family protein [Deinococcota bacterium]